MITVVFATYNGSATLPSCLDAYRKLLPPSRGMRILAVDNGSTDDTINILEGFRNSLPLDVLTCTTRGKNRALNWALKEINDGLIVFTDDDIIPGESWLVSLEEAAERNTEYDIFAGSIGPCWPSSPPAWLTSCVPLDMTFGLTDAQMPEGPIPPELVFGGNMMCRSGIFSLGHRFNEEVGPSSGNYIMGSETEFTTRMSRSGFQCYFTPNAHVKHIIRPSQLTRSWLLQRSFRSGRSSFLRYIGDTPQVSSNFFGMPGWAIKMALFNFLNGIAHGSFFFSDASFPAQWRLYHQLGFLRQAYLSSLKTRSKGRI